MMTFVEGIKKGVRLQFETVAVESSGSVTSNSVIRFGSQSSNEPLWMESDLEDCMRRCKKDWSDEEQEELMESLKSLHELKEWWKNVDKSGDENPRVLRNVSRVARSVDENDDLGMFAHSFGNPELEKILELKMMENSGYRVSSVGTEFNEQATKSSSGKGKRMRVWEVKSVLKGFPGRLVAFLSANFRVLSKAFPDVPH